MPEWLRTIKDYFGSLIGGYASISDPEDNELILEEETSIPIEVPIVIESVEAVPTRTILSKFLSLVLAKENLPRISIATTLTIVRTGINFLSPYLFAKTIDTLAKKEKSADLLSTEIPTELLISMMVASYGLAQALPMLREYALVRVRANTTKKAINTSTEHLLKKSLNYHINTDFSDQVYLLQKSFFVSMAINPILSQVVPISIEMTIAGGTLTYFYGYEVGLGILGLLAIYTVYSALTTKPIIKVKEEIIDKNKEVWEEFTKAIKNYKSMRDFVHNEYTMQKVSSALEQMAEVETKANSLTPKISQGHIAISRIFMLLASLYVGKGVLKKEFSTEEFVIIVGYLNQLCGLLPGFGDAINQIFASWPDLKYVFSELAKPDEVIDLHPEIPLQLGLDSAPSIEFKNISFSYPVKKGETTKTQVFDNVSFTIKPGQKVALVSESGAGKTTLFNLLYGYFTPDSGTILINNQDISEVSLNSVQRAITIFSQNPNLFKGTVRENICFGAQDPDKVHDEDIWELAKSVKLDGFLNSLTKKLDTDVGEDGKALSGGQQQKVAILRGLMKKGCIYLMDEITASLDSQAAKEIVSAMREINQGVSSLMITHKLTEIREVDLIVVIGQGKIIAQGTHHELLKDCTLYQKLWKAYENQNELSSNAKMMNRLGPQVSVDTKSLKEEMNTDSILNKTEDFSIEENQYQGPAIRFN